MPPDYQGFQRKTCDLCQKLKSRSEYYESHLNRCKACTSLLVTMGRSVEAVGRKPQFRQYIKTGDPDRKERQEGKHSRTQGYMPRVVTDEVTKSRHVDAYDETAWEYMEDTGVQAAQKEQVAQVVHASRELKGTEDEHDNVDEKHREPATTP